MYDIILRNTEGSLPKFSGGIQGGSLSFGSSLSWKLGLLSEITFLETEKLAFCLF